MPGFASGPKMTKSDLAYLVSLFEIAKTDILNILLAKYLCRSTPVFEAFKLNS